MKGMNVEVKDSVIEGRGLFAVKNIPKNTKINIGVTSDTKGMIMNDQEFHDFMAKCKKLGQSWDSVTLAPGKHSVAVSDRDSNPGNFGNHSCDPNCVKSNQGLVARRDIDTGEEVTVDYRLFSDKSWTMVCNCGAANCLGVARGTI